MKNNLSKHYGKFTNKERINLSLAALARGDYEELEKLCDSCKKVTYKQLDINYSDKMKRLMLMHFWYKLSCAEFGIELSERKAAKNALESEIAGYIKCANDVFEDVTFDDEDMAKNHPAVLKAEKYGSKYRKKMLKIEKDIDKTISKIIAIHKALKLVCEEQGICFNNLLLFYIFNGEGDAEEIPDFSELSDMEADEDVLKKLIIDFRGVVGGTKRFGING